MSNLVLSDPIVVGYYESWKQPQTVGVDFSKYTHINLAFGIPNADGTFVFDETLAIPETVSTIRAKGAKVLVSIGGWSGSNLISTILKDTTANANFMTNIVNYIKTNDLDGVDLDWEYPGKVGAQCNVVDEANDTPNYLVFLQGLKAAFAKEFGEGKKLITMAVYVMPFYINGAPSTDVSEFAKVVDYAHLMQYDINGAWLEVSGPNAPLNFAPNLGTQFSFASAIDAWTGAGWPAEQLTAGMAFYGRATTMTVDMTLDEGNMYQAQTKVIPKGDSEDATWADVCDKKDGMSGQWQYKHLRDQGVLTDPSTAAAPMVRTWDNATMTPWLFNPEDKMFISYDDPESIQVKVEYAASKGLAGAMVWSIHMDYEDELLDTILKWPAGGSTSNNNDPAKSSSANDNDPKKSSTSNDNDPKKTSSSNDNDSKKTSSSNDNDSKQSSSSNDKETIKAGSSAGGSNSAGSCSTDGEMTCKDSGNSNVYYVCVYGGKVELSCGPGTVCTESDGSIICDWAEGGDGATGGDTNTGTDTDTDTSSTKSAKED
ncbi:hypothetical protein IW147_003654 [Coemansia sp. RSA 720]|nr:hypothetical protein IW147_003654 [Coemansia sp. RSA 720]